MKSRILLILKGMCMGLADVVPGVSGGTMAFVLGIYVEFIEALKSLHVRWLALIPAALVAGLRGPAMAALVASIGQMHLPFLITLGTGIVLAFAVGSVVIPALMDAYPIIMFAFFTGLILASTIVPIQQMTRRGALEIFTGVAVAVATYIMLGAQTEPPVSWNQYQADERMSLEDFNRRFPSVRTPEQLYCTLQADVPNDRLRDAIHADPEQPGVAQQLDQICDGLRERLGDRRAYLAYRDEIGTLGRKDHDNPFNNAVVPAGTPVMVPAPPYWFIFISGVIGICAMVLPGISGSFLLLIMGVYHFMLSGALKGFFRELLHGHIPVNQGVYVFLFILGCLVGILSFARVLSYLFRHHENITLAAMVGLMIGSLRGIWPWRVGDTAVGMVAYLPSTVAELMPGVVAVLAGFALVAAMSVAGQKMGGVEASSRDEG